MSAHTMGGLHQHTHGGAEMSSPERIRKARTNLQATSASLRSSQGRGSRSRNPGRHSVRQTPRWPLLGTCLTRRDSNHWSVSFKSSRCSAQMSTENGATTQFDPDSVPSYTCAFPRAGTRSQTSGPSAQRRKGGSSCSRGCHHSARDLLRCSSECSPAVTTHRCLCLRVRSRFRQIQTHRFVRTRLS